MARPENAFEKIVSLCKRRGFIFQSSEIYGGLSSAWDYGPLGVELKNNVKKAWWQSVVYGRKDMEGLDAAIIMNRLVWQYSGHEKTFVDPLVDCKKCRKRFRADHISPEFTLSGSEGLDATSAGRPKCPECGGELTEPRDFNGMFQTHVGPVQDESGLAYLRPETAQGIFANFLNVLQSMRRKLPFGIAQIGKAFRNEITPGNFTFRTREFEQMEIEYFCKPPQYLQPGEKTDDQLYQEWVETRYNWYLSLGISPERLKKRPQAKEELAHYAKACVDLEYLFPGSLGWSELEGVANRQDYDLTAHSNNVSENDLTRLKLSRNEHSTEKLEYFDESYSDPATGKKGAKYIPFVIEPSAGADRATLAFLCEAYDEEQLTRPDEAAVKPLLDAIDAALKNIQKRIAEAAKRPGSADIPNGEQLEVLEKSFLSAKDDLPGKLLQIDVACSRPGADKLDLVKKVKLIAGKLGDEHTRAVLRLHPKLAPIKVAVLPLKKNEPRIVELGKGIENSLAGHFRAVYDDTAGIGKLYRRQDEVGTPFCVTVDFQSLEDGTVTLRDRDTMRQERVKIEELAGVIGKKLS
ncbi:glycine--tRNA ligase [candidate division TA06 bacterium]|uniref:Glycine--tRNA ligase n=1 Tax=candidate division TA06 bacterium TaxID=2250710 RepID=A0A933IC71_UNCT6|nr:glycine--tRNA ligase [candidate division TA06 bacterium]